MRAVIPSRPRPIQTSFLIVVFSLGMGNVSAQAPLGFTETKLTASDGDLLDEFGRSVDLDGNTLVVGAWVDDDACPDELLCNSGSAYVFVREGSGWIEWAKLTADDAQAGDNFGFSIAIHDDTIVVGARLDDDGGSNAGSAYVFSREGPDWVQEFKLLAGDPGGGDFFGYSVDIDHDTVVIGSWLDNDLGGDSGSAYVFVREGTAWTQQAKLVASDGTRSDRFGAWVAIDGDTIVVGAREADGVETSTGAAYIFVREGAVWTE